MKMPGYTGSGLGGFQYSEYPMGLFGGGGNKQTTTTTRTIPGYAPNGFTQAQLSNFNNVQRGNFENNPAYQQYVAKMQNMYGVSPIGAAGDVLKGQTVFNAPPQQPTTTTTTTPIPSGYGGKTMPSGV